MLTAGMGEGSQKSGFHRSWKSSRGIPGGDDSHLDLGQHREDKLLDSRCDPKVDMTLYQGTECENEEKEKSQRYLVWGLNH